MTISDIYGWSGAVLILAAYFVVSFRFMAPRDNRFQVMNLFGALGLLVNAYAKSAWPFVVIEVAWVLIALVSLLRPSEKSAAPDNKQERR